MTGENPNPDELKRLYDERYAGNYMDKDRYGIWIHEGVGCLSVRQTLSQIPIQPRRILDYGCGQGGWIQLLSMTFPDAKIYGIDISDTAIVKARKRYPEHAFSTFDGARAPFPDESFDLIFSFHVLEHVHDIEGSIRDISRITQKGGYACIIFPCGNKNSLEEKAVCLMERGKVPSCDGRTVHFYEVPDGHLRRMTSEETISLFAKQGLKIVSECYSGQFFGAVDWLCRSTWPEYINRVFRGRRPIDYAAKVKLDIMRRTLLLLNCIVSRKSLELLGRSSSAEKAAAYMVRSVARMTDRLILILALLEWLCLKRSRNGSVQFLVFQKTAG